MKWPQIVVIILFSLDVGLALALHGQPKKSRYSFWAELIADGLFALLLYIGGFWG